MLLLLLKMPTAADIVTPGDVADSWLYVAEDEPITVYEKVEGE